MTARTLSITKCLPPPDALPDTRSTHRQFWPKLDASGATEVAAEFQPQIDAWRAPPQAQ